MKINLTPLALTVNNLDVTSISFKVITLKALRQLFGEKLFLNIDNADVLNHYLDKVSNVKVVEKVNIAIQRLTNAKLCKNDEFYTQLSDVNKELVHYKEYFKNKVVLCNCDDESSAFWEYFHMLFESIGLKKLIATHYDRNKPTYKVEYMGGNDNDLKCCVTTPLKGDGDFRNDENISLLQEADIVVTNPPFSLFREYIAQLIKYNKKFIVIGNQNAIKYKEIFPLIKDNKLWLGYGSNLAMVFKTPYVNVVEKNRKLVKSKGFNPDDGYIVTPAVSWFTNIEHTKRHEPLILWKEYHPEEYPKYDNYDAIEVKKVELIPKDYFYEMGVPITFMDKYCPEQFEIIGGYNYSTDLNGKPWNAKVNGEYVYARILIKRK